MVKGVGLEVGKPEVQKLWISHSLSGLGRRQRQTTSEKNVVNCRGLLRKSRGIQSELKANVSDGTMHLNSPVNPTCFEKPA